MESKSEALLALEEQECIPCQSNNPRFTPDEYKPYLEQIDGWIVEEEKMLVKTYLFSNFDNAMFYANLIAAVAEKSGHHPDLYIRWGELSVFLWTHKIDGLSLSDFILAAKIDREYDNMPMMRKTM